MFTVKNKMRSTTPNSRQSISKKEQSDYEESQNSNPLQVAKMETTAPDFDGEEDEDDYSHDGYSHSINSVQSTSLPPTPEPRNETPTLHTTRPSSKSSSMSVTSHTSNTATSTPPPERKATSYINVSGCTFSRQGITNFNRKYFCLLYLQSRARQLLLANIFHV